MSYALRNTLALGIVLLLTLLGGGYWTRVRMGGQLEKLRKVETERRKRWDEVKQRYAGYETARVALESLKTKWVALPKTIPLESSTASVFAYLNDLTAVDRSPLQFSFDFQRDVKESEYGYGVYRVRGSGSFRDVYNLIWRIEHESPLMKMASIEIQRKEMKEGDRTRSEMQFEMVLHAYYSHRKMPTHRGTMAYDVRDPFVGYDPFDPLVQETLPLNTEGLVEVEKAILEAITADRVVVRDSGGKRWTFRMGDRVYLGQLGTILPDARQAVFVLNKGGIVKRVVLEMGKAVSLEEPMETSVGQQVDQRAPGGEKTVRFLGVEVIHSNERTRVMIRNTGLVPYQHFELDTPPRIVLEMEPAVYAWDQRSLKVEDPVIREIRAAQFKPRPPVVRVVIELEDRVYYAITQRQGEIVVNIPTSMLEGGLDESRLPTEGDRLVPGHR